MVQGLIGKKIGMTQVFDQQGNAVPVTVIQVGPCVVVGKRWVNEQARLQLGFVDARRKAKVTKPLAGVFKRAGVPPASPLKEFDCEPDDADRLNLGDHLLVSDVFEVGQLVDVSGRTKGHGFQGVVKRHGFRGGRATHGSMFHRAPGSIGGSAYPSRVFPGMRAAGHMGTNRVKIRKLQVVDVDSENNLLLVKGSVPGARGNVVLITQSQR
ncbi:MAG TPA: 50S ribosomal protein L3 [Acidobacteriota bacterium]|nr:50S ribosomal protein L3 [Acidobacteriota bacterium]